MDTTPPDGDDTEPLDALDEMARREVEHIAKTGGSAFPHDGVYASGMTLRDWFAGMALQGMLADPNCLSPAASLAISSYEIADAMLKARAAK